MCKSCIITRLAILIATLFMTIEVFGQQQIETVIQKGHLSQVLCSAFSPDGKYLATGSVDNTVKLWNVSNGKEIRSFSGHTEKVRSVMFSNDGKRLLSCSADNNAMVFDVITGKRLFTLPHSRDYLMKAVFSPKNNYIVTMTNRDDMYLWEAKTGTKIKAYKKPFSSDITPYVVSPGEHLILTGDSYKEFYATSIDGSDTLAFEFDKANTMAFSPNGEYIVAGSAKLFAGVYDPRSGKQTILLEATPDSKCDGCNTKFAISSDSRYVATAANRSDFALWDVQKGKKVKTFVSDIKDRVVQVGFSPGNAYVYITDDKVLSVYDIRSGKLKWTWNSALLSGYEPTFSPDDQYIVTPGENNTAYLWDIESATKTRVYSGYLNQRGTIGFDYSNWTERNILRFVSKKSALSVSPTGQYLFKGRIDSTVVMIDLSTGKQVRRFTGHSKAVLSTAVSPDGNYLATGGGDGLVKIWDIATGTLRHTLKGHVSLIFDVSFSNDGTMLCSSSWDASTRIWDVSSGEQIGTISTGEVSQFTNAFLPGDLYLAIGNLDKNVGLWEIDSREQFLGFTGHTDVITDIAFKDNGALTATTSWDGTAKIWRTETGLLTRKLRHDGAGLFAVTVTDNSIITGGNDHTIRIWDINSDADPIVLTGHSGAVISLTLIPGDRLVSCGDDDVIKVWDLKTRKELYSYMLIDRDNWLVKHASGRFDGSAEGMKLVNYVSGLEVIPVGSLFQKYYAPGLLKRIMQGEEFKDMGENLDQTIRDAPATFLSVSGAGKRQIGIDSVMTWRKNVLPLEVQVRNTENPGDIRIYRNGKLIVNEPFEEKLVFRGGKPQSRKFEIDLTDGENDISVVVLNERKIESSPASIKVNYDGEAAMTDLYILSIGINAYKNPDYKLNFAVNDAISFTHSITNGATDLFNKVYEYNIKDTAADKPGIATVFNKIIKEIGPEDVFVFYYAGHGVMSIEKEQSEFYLVTYDVTNFYGSVEQLRAKAISANELLEFSRQISAEKQLFVMDACQSGGALTAFAQRGAVREKALAQLARSSGTFFLTASEDAQYANEVGGLEHGMFTYAILEALKGTADGGAKDSKITVSELKAYVEDRVPELSEQYQGSPQYPTSYSFGQDFPVTLIK